VAKRNKDSGLWKDSRSPNWQIDKAFGGQRLRCSAGTSDRGEAQAKVDAWVDGIKRDQLLESLGVKPKAADTAREMTILDACERYFDEIGRAAKASDQELFRMSWICDHINTGGAGKATKLSDITENTILDMCAIRRGEGRLGIVGKKAKQKWRAISEHTIARSVVEPMRALLRRAAVTWKVRVAVIDWKTLLPKRSKEGRAGSELKASKQTEVFQKLRIDIHEATSFLLIHGIRSGRALMGMSWEHVDFDTGMFRVLRKTKLHGDHYQEVPMTAASRQLLLAQQGRHPTLVWTYVVHRTHIVDGVVHRAGERRPLTKSVLRGQLKDKALKNAGLDTFRIHDMRHTAARRTLRASKNIRAVQRVLGHADIATTAIYADVLVDDVRDALEAAAAAQSLITENPRNIPGVEAETEVVSAEAQEIKGEKRA
jgi:integrase